MKKNLLIVGDYNRDDFLYVAKVMQEEYNIFFLEYTLKEEIKSMEYQQWGKAIFWSDFKDAIELIEKIKPEKVLFYFIETFNHVALNVSCKYRGIKTYHMEHGVRSYEIAKNTIKLAKRSFKNEIFLTFEKIKTLKSRIKGRMFFKRTIQRLPAPFNLFLKEYFFVRKSKSISETFQEIDNPLRIADCYISFSRKIFEFHIKSDHLQNDHPVYFIGCPSFDYLANVERNQNSKNSILFIDNAFETQRIFGWSIDKKIQFLNRLIEFAQNQERKLWIKIHPYSGKEVYEQAKKSFNVELIEDKNRFLDAFHDSNIIIGFYSALLMPFMAMDHTVCFSLEMHPLAPQVDLSSFLVETGATKRIDNWEQLAHSFENLDLIHQEQKSNKAKFIKDWMFKFDGRATERLRSILLDEAS